MRSGLTGISLKAFSMSILDREASRPQWKRASAIFLGLAIVMYGTLSSIMASLNEAPFGWDMSNIGLALPFLVMTKRGFVLIPSSGGWSKGPATKPFSNQDWIVSAKWTLSWCNIFGLGVVRGGSLLTSINVSAPLVRSLMTWSSADLCADVMR